MLGVQKLGYWTDLLFLEPNDFTAHSGCPNDEKSELEVYNSQVPINEEAPSEQFEASGDLAN